MKGKMSDKNSSKVNESNIRIDSRQTGKNSQLSHRDQFMLDKPINIDELINNNPLKQDFGGGPASQVNSPKDQTSNILRFSLDQ